MAYRMRRRRRRLLKFLSNRAVGIVQSNISCVIGSFLGSVIWCELIPILWIERTANDQALQSGEAYFQKDVPEEPVSYKQECIEWYAISVPLDQLQLRLPEVASNLPSDTGESPLANARECLCRLKDWCYFTTTR